MCSVNSMLESQIKTARAEYEDIQIGGNHQDSNECLFFNTSSDQGILPLVELPPDIVRMVMEESLPPLGTCQIVLFFVYNGDDCC